MCVCVCMYIYYAYIQYICTRNVKTKREGSKFRLLRVKGRILKDR